MTGVSKSSQQSSNLKDEGYIPDKQLSTQVQCVNRQLWAIKNSNYLPPKEAVGSVTAIF
ncbi:hypothetical protein [Photorhabdus asymbiotica]|uniref:hypothetical protein n=1 Tax=Photorhabdus asymbiotica TaxID=291112 RepID=UPI003DA79E00